ncbi:hypothetical protein [Litorimonas sp. WD9-15]|uniref:hypothetical protein n=1 Tax=Litorimonas sp. WD9-15 TaxID=3418716 RepID=UPI003D07D6E5
MTIISKFHLLTIFTLLALVLSSCANNEDIPSKQTVHDWSETTLKGMTANQSTDFETFIESVLMTDTTDIPKTFEALDFTIVIKTGTISSFAEHCGLDYDKNNFDPMMYWQRQHLPESEHSGEKISMIGFFHGYGMGKVDNWLKENEVDCSAMRASLKGQLFKDKF